MYLSTSNYKSYEIIIVYRRRYSHHRMGDWGFRLFGNRLNSCLACNCNNCIFNWCYSKIILNSLIQDTCHLNYSTRV